MRAPQKRQRRKSQKIQSTPLHVKLPSKTARSELLIAYELNGAQEFINLLSKHYGFKRMKIIVDGRKVRNGFDACYSENKACFKKNGVKKNIVLHEFYHHLVNAKGYEPRETVEEKEANAYARESLKVCF